METLEICNFLLISRLGQCVESGFYEFGDASTKHALLSKKVGLGFFFKRGLDDSSAGCSDSSCVCQSQVPCLTRRILMNSEKSRNPLAVFIHSSNEMSGSFWRHHEYVYAFVRYNLSKMNIEAVSENESIAGIQVGLNGCFI